jgi:hypothetical protein
VGASVRHDWRSGPSVFIAVAVTVAIAITIAVTIAIAVAATHSGVVPSGATTTGIPFFAAATRDQETAHQQDMQRKAKHEEVYGRAPRGQ